jgi:hypothetical protein
VVHIIFFIDIAGLVEVATDSVDDEEEESHDEDGEHNINSGLPCIATSIP